MIDMLNDRIDPYGRAQDRMQQRLLKLANPFGMPQVKQKQPEPYSLTEDQRQGWLNTIADGTMGSLAKFGNFLDVPGSSMREVLKGATGGGWSNPFDQWAPWNWTNDKGRVSGRDLGRQWGWMSKKDTWGNLFGGIGIEIATDPLLLLGFGGGAVSKGGRFAKLSGLDKYMPQLLDSTNAARIAKEGEKATQVGMNELWRSATVKDLLGAAGPADELGDALRIAARAKADSAAKRFGYNSLDEALAEFGDQPLRGIARYGLPNLKMFGARNAEKLKGAPEILMGLGEAGRKYGKAWDAVTGPLGRSFPAVMAKQALESASQGFGQYWTQAKARAGWEMKEAGEVAAKQGIGEAQAMVDTIIPKELRPSSTNFEQAVKDNHEYRKLFEDYAQGTPAQRAVVEKVWKHVDEAFNEAKRFGAKVDPLDDMYTKHFPRSLSAFLKKSESDAFKEVVRKFPTNSPVHAWNENMLARHPVLKDIKGGTEAFDRIVQDPIVHKILDNDKIKTGKRLYQLSRYLEKKYGPKGQNIFAWGERGEKIRGTEISDITDAASEMLAGEYKTKQVTAVQGAKEIMEDAALSDSDKAIKIQMMLDDMDLKAEFGKDLSKGLTMQDRLWMVKNSRYMETAGFLNNISPEARKFGIFGNWPLYDAENYMMRMRDSASKARTALDILGDERAYSTSVSGAPISKVFRALNLDEEVVVPILAKRLGLKPENILGRVVNSETAKDLINFSTMFDGPEPSKWLGRVLDSFMSAFKANVTAPFPSFHARNFLSGQFRNVIAGNFSFKSLNDSMRMLFGKDIEGIEKLPVIRTRYDKLRAEMPALNLPEQLDNAMANKLIRYMVRENGIVGKYGRDFPLEVMNQSAGSPNIGGSAMSGMAQDLRAAAPGENPFSMRYMGEEYVGLPHKWEVDGTKASSPRSTTLGGPWLPVNPFAIPEKMIGKAALKSGLAKPGGRMERWANKKLIEVPSVFKTPGVYEDMGLTKAGREQIGAFVREGGKETTQRNLMWGPVAGGMHAGHAVEFPNRVGAWLKQIYDGVDPEEAARIVSDTQISYKPKHYTPLESQVLKRLFPFYSFSSKSLPWTIRKFIEKPGNMLSQTIRGTQRTAQHMRNQFHHPGPMPDYLGDTLAIPVEAQEPGAKRYLTGMDLMEQDIWQLGGPALSGDIGSLGFEIAGRAAPLWGKLPIEMITGTSLWQRGVEGGRPLRNLDPLVGRTYANTMQQLARVMGEEIPPEKIREMVGETGTFEKVVANSPYSRYLSSWRTLMDPRKGLGAKATNLLTGSKFQDVSLPAQETLLREHIRNMIAKEGGTIFEKATFPTALMEYWRKNDPEKFIKAMQLKALSDERTKVAKKMQEFTKRGLPAGMAIQQ